jgi:general stress protein 26
MATAATTDDKKPARRAATKTASAKPASSKSASAKSSSTTKAATAKPATKPAASKPKTAKSSKPAAANRAAQPANRQSRDSSMTGKEHDDHVDRVWELAKRIGIAMFVTWDGKEQRARPLAATVEKDEGAIYFLIDVNGEKDDQLAEFPHVSVSFADHKHSKYVALSGKATVSNDRARIKELWTPFAKAWWDSPEDPAIRVIKMVPQDAELWDSPGRIVTTLSMLTAAVTGRSPKIGENAKVVL